MCAKKYKEGTLLSRIYIYFIKDDYLIYMSKKRILNHSTGYFDNFDVFGNIQCLLKRHFLYAPKSIQIFRVSKGRKGINFFLLADVTGNVCKKDPNLFEFIPIWKIKIESENIRNILLCSEKLRDYWYLNKLKKLQLYINYFAQKKIQNERKRILSDVETRKLIKRRTE